jgi:hypothetical protein
MVKKFIHSILLIVFSIPCFSQRAISKYYYDLNLNQFNDSKEITNTGNLDGKRYVRLDYNDGTLRKIIVHDSADKSFTVNVSEENGFRILKFPTRKTRRYEGNWLFFKNNKKSRTEWQISNDTVFIINASKKKVQGASVAIVKLNRSDNLIINSYSICCLDINIDKSDAVSKRRYLQNRIAVDSSITWHTYNLNLDKNILNSHRSNSTLAEGETGDGKPLTTYFPGAGNSLFWLLINYW